MKRLRGAVPVDTFSQKSLARRDFLKGLAWLGALTFFARFASACSPAGKQDATSAPLAALSISSTGEVALPEPEKVGSISVEEALSRRRSIRTYSGKPLTPQELSQLVWAAQGITNSKGYRTAPSAMMSFPLHLYVIVGDVEGVDKGVYKYVPAGHILARILEGDCRSELTSGNAGTYFVKGGALYFVFTATIKAGADWEKWAHMEVGHAAQNVYLQATALGLGTVVNGGFNADRTRAILKIPDTEQLLYIMPVGRVGA